MAIRRQSSTADDVIDIDVLQGTEVIMNAEILLIFENHKKQPMMAQRAYPAANRAANLSGRFGRLI